MKDFQAFAEALADASRAMLIEAARKSFTGEMKSDGSPVTVIDQAVEKRLREMISAAYPDHGIVGEEHGETNPDKGYVWVLDPIDGTLPFLAGIPVYGTLIALLQDGVPQLGLIDMPPTGERWIGCAGSPTTHNGAPVRVRACDSLSQAMLSTSNIDYYVEQDLTAFERLKAATRLNVYGGSCMAYAQIASGRIDVGVDVTFDVFDYLALVPIIEGAGGIITDWRGEPLTLASGDRLIAAGDARIHDAAVQILAG
ncbi:MAG: inositol monophosphatase family protein [Alphaproteobacteria bacterium]|jgi:histidinol phosphatase-like enzyme (inositol monophosphatase family)